MKTSLIEWNKVNSDNYFVFCAPQLTVSGEAVWPGDTVAPDSVDCRLRQYGGHGGAHTSTHVTCSRGNITKQESLQL